MSTRQTTAFVVEATAQEVLPRFGLAFLIDDHDMTWTVTRCTEGPGLEVLCSGQRVRLTLDHHPHFSVVRAYHPKA